MGSNYYNFKKVQTVPSAMDCIDIVLSKIQRKTATVVHPNYQISRIRQFYMKKVKFGQDCFDEKLEQILTDFPKLDEIHPFYADLMNVLYDKDHYKLALGQINTAKHLIDNVARDYARLLKFGDSLYRCKQLKKAALGRMATIMKRQKDSLAYLEQVRQHLARLPSIDPNTRTLLICGYPNVGKSSFMNKLTRAEVEVQPYAFTTKSLFVGHMDYKNLRWQVIDTPGILDHPLEQRNTIEMQSITALAHLRTAVLFFIDLSEQCGYSIASQCSLFESIRPLFANKPTLLVVNKIDAMRYEQLSPDDKQRVDAILALNPNGDSSGQITLLQMSTYTDEGVMDVKKVACDKLLAARVEMKMRGSKINDIIQKLHLAQPSARDDIERPAFIPEGAGVKISITSTDPNRRKLERELEAENGGAGVYNVDLRKLYQLKNPEWRYDYIPEIMDGKNIADFVDPDIEARLEALEREEERLVAEGFYDVEDETFGEDMDLDDEAVEVLEQAAKEVEEKQKMIQVESRLKKGKNRSVLTLKDVARKKTFGDMAAHLKERGISVDANAIRARSLTRKRERSQSRGRSTTTRDASTARDPSASSSKWLAAAGGAGGSSSSLARSQSVAAKRHRVASRDRSVAGVRDAGQKDVSQKLYHLAQRPRNSMAKAGDADRHIGTKMPKHLFSGKRGSGTASHR
ncbi:P-loop containing nucleoside triphosphate hydrolase protein [Zopfochytrium polystomum]|nr:P-loop containing nucleoside triphosphate hydrolase protein [Zopfochytrium polystomum]